MLRLIHNQTVSGAILVDDIDDGLPNKEVHRLGSTADPKAYARDGYANKPKQASYIPRTKKTPVVDPTIQGYIDLNQTERVTLSAGKGKIKKLQTAGLITVVSFSAADLNAPAITNAVVTAGPILTITGTKLLSLTPNFSTVYITGGSTITLTQAQILATVGSTFTDTSIVIPAALIATVIAGDFVQVKSDDQLSNVFTSV
jgi:hypothetical protein